MLEKIIDHLTEEGITIPGQIGVLQEDPDNQYVLNYAGGNQPSRQFKNSKNDKRVFQTEPQIQVRVRNKSYYLAFDTITKIMDLLEGFSGELGTDKVKDIQRISEPLFIGRDEKNRAEFTINIIVSIDKDGE